MAQSELFKRIVEKWNSDADGYNQWTELDEEEKVEFAYLCGAQWAGLKENSNG